MRNHKIKAIFDYSIIPKFLMASTSLYLFISLNLFANAPPYIIKSYLNGVAVPVVIGGKVGVITNAHVVGTKNTAKIIFDDKMIVNFKVVFKWMRSDLVFLIPLKKNPFIEKALEAAAYAKFSPNKKVEYKIFEEKDNFIFTFDNGGHLRTIFQNSFVQPMSVPDYFISGKYNEILYLPFYARPGQSGSPYISKRKWSGILTKVTLGIIPESFAIKVDELNILLQKKYFQSFPFLSESNS